MKPTCSQCYGPQPGPSEGLHQRSATKCKAFVAGTPLLSCAACGIHALDQVDDKDGHSPSPFARVQDLAILVYQAGYVVDEAKWGLLLHAARTVEPKTGKPHVFNLSFWIMDRPVVAVMQVDADHTTGEPDTGARVNRLAPACVVIA